MTNRLLLIYLLLFTLFSPLKTRAQQAALKDSVISISKAAGGTVGVAVMHFGTKETFAVNGDRHFPMQSVMKFPLALAVLHQVDQGKLRLDQLVHLSKEDLSIPVASPIRDKYPEGNIDLSIADLLSYTVSQSDNNGCDKLFQVLGGPRAVDEYMHSIGVKDIAIVATEKQMGQSWQTQYTNWCTPNAMLQLLNSFHNGNILSAQSRDYLWQLMLATVNAPKRMKGLLPPGTDVAHKPGTSGVNSAGIAAATNDIGIVELPDKRRFAAAVFVSDATAGLSAREAAIARITRLCWDYWR